MCVFNVFGIFVWREKGKEDFVATAVKGHFGSNEPEARPETIKLDVFGCLAATWNGFVLWTMQSVGNHIAVERKGESIN